MAEYIEKEVLLQKLSQMIEYCEKNKDKKFNALDVLFQVGDAIIDCPSIEVDKHCFDCKYCEGWSCTHPHREDCVNSSLWTPYWNKRQLNGMENNNEI